MQCNSAKSLEMDGLENLLEIGIDVFKEPEKSLIETCKHESKRHVKDLIDKNQKC